MLIGRKVILDNGHGGVINGVYQTAGKRSPEWYKGVLYEGMFNRWVVNRLIEKLDRYKIPYYHVSPELKDISLGQRVRRANEIYKIDSNVWLLSIHANAGGGEGIEGFTTKGNNTSDSIGEFILTNLKNDLKATKWRFDYSDGDKDKEANFYIQRKTLMPSFLLECGFMDNKNDYKKLWDEFWIDELVVSLFNSIKKIYEG